MALWVRPRDDRAELEWLKTMLPRLRATLCDAERRQIKDEGLVLWLRDIKDLAYDAEDVIDEFEYEELRRKVEDVGGRSSSSGSSSSSLPPLGKAMVHKITRICQRWEVLAKERNDLRIGDLGGSADLKDPLERMAQTSSLKEAEVFGRDEEKAEIVKFLLASDDKIGPSAIVIVGIGGLGKTTLARLVYNDERIVEHFDLKMWVCVTAANCDVESLTRDILASACNNMFFFGMIENLDVLHRKLVEKLKGIRFLLVIDNLWDRNC